MFDIGWQELFLIAVVALIVIGPKDLPIAMRALAKVLSKLRGLSREFQTHVSDMMREAELDEIRRKVDEAGRVNLRDAIDRVVDPDGRVGRAADLGDKLGPEPDPEPDWLAGGGGRYPPAGAAPASAYRPGSGGKAEIPPAEPPPAEAYSAPLPQGAPPEPAPEGAPPGPGATPPQPPKA